MSDLFIVATDGSDASNAALDYAAEQAKKAGAELVLVNVIDWSGYEVMGPEEAARRHKRREEEIARAKQEVIDPALERVRKHGIEAENIIRHGHSATVLIELVNESNARQVFVGRHGHSKLGELFFGSTTHTLVQACPVPVTVVPK
ncbi:MAG: universal stress protein [Alphaproteobacteria bacterium]|nr:universal stress protein [Alphaproteobacteria bacterium]